MTTNSGALSGWFKGKGQRHTEESSAPGTEPTTDAETAGTTTGGGSDPSPVVVWEAANRMEAQIVAGRLQSEGIPAFLRGEALGPIYGLTTGSLAATVVLVPAPLAPKALEILTTDVEWDDFADTEHNTGPDQSS